MTDQQFRGPPACCGPPHPSLISRTRAQVLRSNPNINQAALKAEVHKLIPAEGRVPGLNDGIVFPKTDLHSRTPIRSAAASSASRAAPLRGPTKVAIVLVEFPDVKLGAGAKKRFEDLFFSSGYKIPTGSVTDYYNEVSKGAISFTGNVVGPVTLSKNMAYYANKSSGRSWPESPDNPNSQTMAKETLDKAINLIDWSDGYDNDGNGYVDAFIIVHAGAAADRTRDVNDIWSVQWNLPDGVREANGKKIYGFLTVAEEAKTGVCAHELGHLLFGWPDLYDIDNSSNGIGNWCLMGFGSWGGDGDRPVHPSAWCKQSQGWIDTEVEKENRKITVQDVKSGYKTHRLWTNGDTNSQEYYLIENRQLAGFDASLPGAGLLVWHIDDSMWANSDENHPKVKLMQADGMQDLLGTFNRGDAGDPYPGISNNYAFSSTSNPNSKAYSGADTFVSVSNIPPQPSASITVNITVKAIDQPPTGNFDPKMWYRIKNTFNPKSHSLDIIDTDTTHIEMGYDANKNDQFWQLKANADGTYFIRNLGKGANQNLDLEEWNKNKPQIRTATKSTSQYWKVAPWGDGTWHIENVFIGKDRYLDTMEGDKKVEMNQANAGRPTQRWTITKIRPITESGF